MGSQNKNTVWIKFKCDRGNKWTEVKGPFQSTQDGDICHFYGCTTDHKAHRISETTSPTEALDWFQRKYQKTAEAVVEYDKASAALKAASNNLGTVIHNLDAAEEKVKAASNHLETVIHDLDAAEEKVKAAFAHDSSDINSPENARLVTPNGHNGWLRQFLNEKGFEECSLTPEIRSQRGWGW